MADPRFDTSKDPRFRRAPRQVRRVAVDKRFAHMFSHDAFAEVPEVDARGQRLRRDAAKSKLREFYALEEDGPGGDRAPEQQAEEGEAAEEAGDKAHMAKRRGKKAARAKRKAKDTAPHDTEDSVKGKQAKKVQKKPVARPRHEEPGDDAASSSEESDDEEEDEEDPGVSAQVWETSQAQAVPQGDATRRLAVMGCSWDTVTAADLLALFRTYLASGTVAKKGRTVPNTGSVDHAAVYPSDFGLEELAKEAQAGPQLPTSEKDEDEAKITEAIRVYQLKRTRYYYAIVECDSVATAAHLYDQLDGIDTSGISPGPLDLRFVPDEVQPPHAPTSEATDVPKRYQGPVLQKTPVGHTKVECSWDEAPVKRKRDLMRKSYSIQEVEKMDLEDYLASSSGEEEGLDAEGLKTLARAGAEDSDGAGSDGLFDEDGDKDGDEAEEDAAFDPETMGNKEGSFSLAASKLEASLVERVQQEQQGDNQLHKLGAPKPKTTWQVHLERKKEKRRERKLKAKAERDARKTEGNKAPDEDAAPADAAELELLTMEAQDSRGFNVRGPQRTAARRAARDANREEGFNVDVEDPRIARVFENNPDFAIDPTNPEYRPSAGMQAVLKRKRDRKPTKSALDPAGGLGGEHGTSRSSAMAATASTPAAEAPGSRKQPDAAVPQGDDGRTSVGTGGLQLFATRSRAGAAAQGTAPAVAPAAVDAGAAGRAAKRRRRQQTTVE